MWMKPIEDRCSGYTWYAKSACKTSVNTESKLLLLQYAFEQKAAIAVEFRTHYFNQASRAAIERLGAKQDGVLRSHQIMRDGSIRDTVVYSILQHEWPAVKNNLLSKLSLNGGANSLNNSLVAPEVFPGLAGLVPLPRPSIGQPWKVFLERFPSTTIEF